MKVTDERKKKTVDNVEVSNTFRDYESGEYYIKTTDRDEELNVCVNLETGEVVNFRDTRKVEFVNAELIIRE